MKLIEEEEKLQQIQEEHLEREKQHHLHKQRSPQQRRSQPQRSPSQPQFQDHEDDGNYNPNSINASGSDDEREQEIRKNRQNPFQQQ